MDAVNIILEFESSERFLINQDIYNEEIGCIDFSILIPRPIELDSAICGNSERRMYDLIQHTNKVFNTDSVNFIEDIKSFIKQKAPNSFFLSEEKLTSETLDSIANSIKLYQKYGYFNWYDFNTENWGVSRNAFLYANGKKKRTKGRGFYFSCGWNLPDKWLLKLSEKWKDVEFKIYARPEFTNRNGEVTVHKFLNGICERQPDVKRKF